MQKKNSTTSLSDAFMSAGASVIVLSALAIDLGLAFFEAGYSKIIGKPVKSDRTLFVSRVMLP